MAKVGDVDRAEKFDLYDEWRSVELVERLCREAGRKIVYIMHDMSRDRVRVNGIEGSFNSDRHDLRDMTKAYVDLRTEGVAVFILVYEHDSVRVKKDNMEAIYDFLRCAQNESYDTKPTKKFVTKLDRLVDVVMRGKKDD